MVKLFCGLDRSSSGEMEKEPIKSHENLEVYKEEIIYAVSSCDELT
jgi:hypothetical protein